MPSITKSPTAAASVDSGGEDVAWNTPANVTASDDVRTSANLSPGIVQTHYLRCTSFGFEIPTDATVGGIVVSVERLSNVAGGCEDGTIQLLKNSTRTGSNKADTVTAWPKTEAIATYGASDDKWSATWTPAEINSSNFGVDVRAVKVSGTNSPQVDNVTMQVTYYPPEPKLRYTRSPHLTIPGSQMPNLR